MNSKYVCVGKLDSCYLLVSLDNLSLKYSDKNYDFSFDEKKYIEKISLNSEIFTIIGEITYFDGGNDIIGYIVSNQKGEFTVINKRNSISFVKSNVVLNYSVTRLKENNFIRKYPGKNVGRYSNEKVIRLIGLSVC